MCNRPRKAFDKSDIPSSDGKVILLIQTTTFEWIIAFPSETTFAL